MKKCKITLSDGLKHPGYSWPKTLLSYPVELDVEKREVNELHLLDNNQKEIPFQLTEVHETEGVLAVK